MTRGVCQNFNAALEPWKRRPLTKLLMAFPHSPFCIILVLGYTVTPHQGWPSTHRPLSPCGGRGRGFRASNPSQDHEIYVLFLFFQKRPKITCAPKVALEYKTANGRWKCLGGSSSQHWNECHQIPGRASSLNSLCAFRATVHHLLVQTILIDFSFHPEWLLGI